MAYKFRRVVFITSREYFVGSLRLMIFPTNDDRAVTYEYGIPMCNRPMPRVATAMILLSISNKTRCKTRICKCILRSRGDSKDAWHNLAKEPLREFNCRGSTQLDAHSPSYRETFDRHGETT